MTLQEELKNKDKQQALSFCNDFRRMFGYIQDFTITNDHIKVLLFDDSMIRIYDQLVPKDILYINCSGYLILQIHNVSRIFNYCIAICHPILKAPALPVFECLASTHTQCLFEVCWFILKAGKILFSEIISNLNWLFVILVKF